MLVIKSRRDLFDGLRAAIGKIHSYEVPELLALPIVDGSENSLELGGSGTRVSLSLRQ
jgi:periplasmic divalent cation tolerance protein